MQDKRTAWRTVAAALVLALLPGCTMPDRGASTVTMVASPLPSEPTVDLRPEATQPSTLTPLPSVSAFPTASPEPPEAEATPLPSVGPQPEATQSSTPTPWPSTSASPTASPEPPETEASPQPLPQTFSVKLFEDLDMEPGQAARLQDTGIEVTLVEAHGPPPDCFDCPNSATLDVRLGGETQTLSYSFSGNMVFELLLQAKRKTAFGYVFVAVRIVEGSFTLRVEPDTQ